MARPPARVRSVFFLGAGFGRSAGLPNTAELLSEAHRLAAEKKSWGISKRLEERLRTAYEFFYPTQGEGFMPDVVDFFSVLSSYGQIDQGGLPQGFADRSLLADLRFAVVHLLCERLKKMTDESLTRPHELLDRMIRPGNVVITTNWDTLVERACTARGIPYRLWGAPEDGAVVVLKLHGSIDWLLRKNAKKSISKSSYADLRDLVNSQRARKRTVRSANVLRTIVSRPGAIWQTIKSSTNDPYMITMAPGKADALGPLLDLWSGAYRAVSSARELDVIGYSMPENDIEIRTLLRAGVLRGSADPHVMIRNPAPDVHERFRRFIVQTTDSDYTAVPPVG